MDRLESELENLIVLSSNVRLYVPSTEEVNEACDNSLVVRETADLFSECFGGATIYKALGCWRSPAVGLVTEDVTIVESYCGEAELSENIRRVLLWAKAVKARMSQEAIALSVNGKLYFV
jgi:hypothetical protein